MRHREQSGVGGVGLVARDVRIYDNETIEVEGGELWEIHQALRVDGGNGEAENVGHPYRCR